MWKQTEPPHFAGEPEECLIQPALSQQVFLLFSSSLQIPQPPSIFVGCIRSLKLPMADARFSRNTPICLHIHAHLHTYTLIYAHSVSMLQHVHHTCNTTCVHTTHAWTTRVLLMYTCVHTTAHMHTAMKLSSGSPCGVRVTEQLPFCRVWLSCED